MKCDPTETSDAEQALPISSSEAAASESAGEEKRIEIHELHESDDADVAQVCIEVEGDDDKRDDRERCIQFSEDAAPLKGSSGSDSQKDAADANIEVCVSKQPEPPAIEQRDGTVSPGEVPEADTTDGGPIPPNEAIVARKKLAQALARTSVFSVKEVPKGLVRAATVMATNAVMMAVAEIIIEVLVLAGVYPKLPFRLDFFFLTILSGLLGLHTVRGMMKDQFDTSMNALQVSGLVEIALIAGDTKFMVEQQEKYSASIPTRTAFAVLTAVNLVLVVYMAVRLLNFHNHRKKLPVL